MRFENTIWRALTLREVGYDFATFSGLSLGLSVPRPSSAFLSPRLQPVPSPTLHGQIVTAPASNAPSFPNSKTDA